MTERQGLVLQTSKWPEEYMHMYTLQAHLLTTEQFAQNCPSLPQNVYTTAKLLRQFFNDVIDAIWYIILYYI